MRRLAEWPGAERVQIQLPTHYRPCNPAVVVEGDRLTAVVRTVNYELRENASITIRGPAPDTQNWLVTLDAATLAQREAVKIADATLRQHPVARDGLEDMRAFTWRGQLWGLASAHNHLNARNTMVLAPVSAEMAEMEVLLSPKGEGREKNWGVLIKGDALFFVYWASPLQVYRYVGGRILEPVFIGAEYPELDGWCGSSPYVPHNGRHLALLHKREGEKNGRGGVMYRHRLVELDAEEWRFSRISAPFCFEGDQVEFNSGLALQGGNAVIGYGVKDAAACILRLPLDALDSLLGDSELAALEGADLA